MCKELVGVTFALGLVKIEDPAFESCNALEHLEIPTTVKSIGSNAFCNCEKLVNIELNEGLIRIEDLVFIGCKSLQCINAPHP
jgi:hypothetical protein